MCQCRRRDASCALSPFGSLRAFCTHRNNSSRFRTPSRTGPRTPCRCAALTAATHTRRCAAARVRTPFEASPDDATRYRRHGTAGTGRPSSTCAGCPTKTLSRTPCNGPLSSHSRQTGIPPCLKRIQSAERSAASQALLMLSRLCCPGLHPYRDSARAFASTCLWLCDSRRTFRPAHTSTRRLGTLARQHQHPRSLTHHVLNVLKRKHRCTVYAMCYKRTVLGFQYQ